MCGSQRPEIGADSGLSINYLPEGGYEWVQEPEQVACGHWIENGDAQGFCHLPPLHDGTCIPPQYEVSD